MISKWLTRHFSLESSFKSRNFLKDFFKFVHPDILHGAPERVREENSRSLQLLNAYLDKLKKNEGSDGVEVKFFTPEKTNRKNKKYFFFKVRLDRFKQGLGETELDSLRKRVGDSLLDSLNEVVDEKVVGGAKAAAKAETTDKEGTGIPFGYVDLNEATRESHPGLFSKNSQKREEFISEMKAINDAYKYYLNNAEEDELIRNISESILLIDPGNRQRKEYATHLAHNLEFMQNKKILISNLFDPRYIMLDRDVSERVITECRLDLTSLKVCQQKCL